MSLRGAERENAVCPGVLNPPRINNLALKGEVCCSLVVVRLRV
jgi:hypothetical protein